MSNDQPVTHDLRPQWSDDELDRALATLRPSVEPGERALRTARVAMLAEAARLPSAVPLLSTTPGIRRARRRFRRPVLIAAAVVLLVAGGLIVPTVRWGSKAGNTAAADALNRAAVGADRSAAAGDAIAPGKYRYIDSDGWYMSTVVPNTGRAFSYLHQERDQMWVPADWHDVWMDRRSSSGQRKWIVGSDQEAAAQGDPGGVASIDPALTAPCASYYTDMCATEGSWQSPSQAWIAGLPKNPDDMWDRLYDDSKGHGQSQTSEMLVQATDVLRTGLLPASVRATLYRAMAMIDGVQITDTAVTLDGRVGTGFSVESPSSRDETIIDPVTGDFIGERSVALTTDSGIPAGTVIDYTTVHTWIVDGLGATGP